jgi:3-deoxy-D-manno-octulosonic-acid transferase
MSLALYRLATVLLGPAINAYLRRRLARGKEDGARFAERLGHASVPRPAGEVIWLHAASVGETVSVLPLIDGLIAARPSARILVTSGSVTSAAIAGARLPAGAVHQYAPVDRPDAVARFLDHWRPDIAVWVESELWPNLVRETHRRGIPMALINGRMSAHSFRRWRLLPFFIKPLLACFSFCAAQSQADADRYAALGARGVAYLGNLKQAAAPLQAPASDLESLREAIGGRPRWLAASTHPGEDEIVARVHRRLACEHPGLLTILVPRHPDRGDDIAALLASEGLTVARRSRGDIPDAGCDVYLGDSMGEMGLYYRLSDIVFVGGSLIEHGGQNPLEPARLDCALLAGPHMFNFAEPVADLAAAGALRTVASDAELAQEVGRLLNDPALTGQRANAALRVAAENCDVVDALVARLTALLPADAA